MRNSQNSLRVRQGEIMKAHRQLDVAQSAMGETRLLTPFDSLVGRVYLRAGEAPKIAEKPVLDLVSLEKLYAEVLVPPAHLGPGVPMFVDVEGDTTSRRGPAIGSVILAYPDVDPATRMFRIEVSGPASGDLVRPGMFAKVSADLLAKRP
jgi:hypothetical protein